MGLLTVGKALTPEEVQKISSYIRMHGVLQFLNTWQRVKGEIGCGFMGGRLPVRIMLIVST
jgi:glutamate--cysteine ligase catalytic subunit